MDCYDPHQAPNTEEWLALDEAERIGLVQAYHRRARIQLPNQRLHAAIHAIVENQIAVGDELPVRRKLAALMREGLDRHQAVHAIGCALGGLIYDLMKGEGAGVYADERYYEELSKLTAASWRADHSDPNAE